MSTPRKPDLSPAALHTLQKFDTFVRRHAMSPTLRELGAECGISYSAAAYHVRRLASAGYLVVTPKQQRGIERVGKPARAPKVEG